MDQDELRALLSENLGSLLDEKNLNPSAWAKEAGMGHTGVRDIISGKVKNPTYRTLLRLAEVADVDVRRITVGPNYLKVDDEVAELAEIMLQLQPSERQMLLNVGRSQLAAKDQSQNANDEAPE